MIMLCCPLPSTHPPPHTASKATTGTVHSSCQVPTASPSAGQHNTGRGRQQQTGTLLGEDSWLARGGDNTHRPHPDLLREAGIQLKARHNTHTQALVTLYQIALINY